MSSHETPSPSPAVPAGGSAFAGLALSPATLANLARLGYSRMTPIQAASLPPALAGKDLIAQAKTGSGKTAAFALALLANLNPRRFAVQTLVLCPTRELADQVARGNPPPGAGRRQHQGRHPVRRCGPARPARHRWSTARTSWWSARRAASWTTWSAAT